MGHSPPRRKNDNYRGAQRDSRDRRRLSRSPDRRRYDERRRDRDHYDDRGYGRDDREHAGRHERRSDRDFDRRRDRDRDGRNDREYGGRYERDHHGSRHSHDRSRDRHTPRDVRERTPSLKDGSRRTRDRDDAFDHERDPKRVRRGSHSSMSESSRPTTTADAKPAIDDKAARARQARVEEWKAKKLAVGAEGAAVGSPLINSPAASGPATGANSPAPAKDENTPDSPPRAKHDPKAIASRVKAKTEKIDKAKKAPLGIDAAIPAANNGQSNLSRMHVAKAAPANVPVGEAKITAFGLNKGSSDRLAASKTSVAFEEDEDVQREFRKLPDEPQFSDSIDTALANGHEDQEEVDGDLRSDEEEAEASRASALRRAEAQAEQQDVEMSNAATGSNEAEATADAAAPEDMDVDDDVDPLDAFMNNLEPALPPPRVAKRSGREPQVFDEDDGPAIDAVGEDPEELLKNPKRKKKELGKVDHSKIEYEPFRKDFYSESIEVAAMDQEEVDNMRIELDNIKVRGKDVPKPVTKWSQCGLGAQILDIIQAQKFESPTAIQCQALPALMSGRDTIGIAKTGSGKTVAFILPMFRHIKDQRPVANLEGPIGLIMTPTRELAVQIHRECKPYLKALNLRGVCAYGGAPIKDQIAELKRGAEVVVCTPGRMIDLLTSNAGRVTNLRRVTYTVMDEADRMFDLGFGPQITAILDNIRPDRQTVTFSATFPQKIENLARQALQSPVEIIVGGRSVVAAEITQSIEVMPDENKFRRTLQLLGDLHEADEDARSLIFVERQETADNIFKELGRKGYPSVSVHGGREQIDRDQAILDFKAGHVPIMVATSVAARGLDVKQLKLVINFDCPNHGEDYVHRAGRTGRAGNTGTAVTFVTPEQGHFAPFLVKCLQDSNQEVPEALQKLADDFKTKLKSGEVTKKAGSGFGGKGIERLDAARAAERASQKGMYKTGDEPESDDEDKPKDKKETEVDKLVAKAAGSGVKSRDDHPASGREDAPAASEPHGASTGVLDSRLAEHLNNAMKVQKAVTPPPAGAKPAISDALARVQAAAAGINSRLGKQGSSRPGAPADNRGPDAGAYSATLEINDFPQKARWGVTNRTNVAKILESTGTSITSKGQYYAPGAEPQAGQEPKLYILVEGDTEIAVSSAMRELSRHLREGTIAAQDAEARGGIGGRYRVV